MNRNNVIKPGWGLLCLCMLLAPLFVRSQETPERECILIVSSYNPDTRRMARFITEFEQQILALGIPCDICIETLECKGIADAALWMSLIDNMITRYESRSLRAVVLLGQEAWASFVSLGRIPEGVMCFCGFVSSNGVMLPPPPDSLQTWKPRSVEYQGMTDSLKTVGGMLNRYNIRRNVELIRSLYPQVENIALVTDNTYGGISLQALVREEWKHYPDLNLILVDSRQGEEAVHEAYASLPPRSAVMLGTWRVGCDGEYLMQRSLIELVQSNPRIPVFSITRTCIGDVAIGGYVPEYESGAPLIATQIKKYYDTGRIDDVHFHTSKNVYLFDSRKLKEWKIAEYALPKGSVVEDTIAAKLSKYSHYIELLMLGILLLVLLLLFVTWLLLRVQRLKRTLEEREGQLVVARERAEESDMLKSAFLANMSHEIRTPLNAIVGFSSLMQSEELSQEERAEYCDIVVNNSEMLLTLLNDILDISSLECGKIRFNYASEEIVQICQHALMTTAHTRQEGVEGRFECAVDSFMLTTDAHRLSQILINLLTNAGKFTSEGSITLGVEIDKEHGEVLFSVTDTGPGIPPDKQEMVFNRFEKLEGNKKKGTGLGLAICRQIAVIIGGRIWVDPTYTGGARFIFAHPLDIGTGRKGRKGK
ncbi:sensor histidine kinase [Alistipes senegalensis]|uniref:histidine kinase n=1 Tax=Alistipes senegalensis JC50 TaxID=1033732 RepID=A0ABY5VAV3_9BACT|nr:ATP-binding protein [Alistipes senegalensis]MDY4571010.1 ATP-binding protein [Alistipes senegalensis]MDY5241755.1 ATP-binding protein [Alistipes senegalensis]UEA88729.1 two-component sensor histidine kinase [Alistipes senegalensis]UWN66725.1 ATP-binding protein [Alistipes senegalensis JC50]